MREPLPVILNRSSGGAEDRETADRVRSAFRSTGAEVDLQWAESGEDVVRLARRAAAGATDVVVAGGGDGTVGSVASVLSGAEKALGVLPLGTFNHFARDLAIPLDAEEAARTVVEGRVVRVDLGEVNGRIFVNNSSLGLYPRIVRRREEQRQRLGWGKWPAFLWATLHALHRRASLDVLFSIDGRELRRRTPFVFVGNNVYEIQGFDIGCRDRLDGGELSVYFAPGARPLDLIFFAIRAFLGRLSAATTGFEVLRTTELRIDTSERQARVANDGEVVLLATPLRYRVRPEALRVMVPRDEGAK
jgi:diacylglycerol kinase family enzyme